jgi:stage II sporulation protein GA (sporulation sigma-E factor processing peptidase)
MGHTVYVDQFLFGNLLMNYAILWTAAKLCRLDVSAMRKCAGAGAGALYSLAALLPGQGILMSIQAKLLVSILIVLLTCFPQCPKTFFTFLACFYLSSFALGGMVFGSMFFLNNGNFFTMGSAGAVITQYFWPGILIGLPIFCLAARALTFFRQGQIFDRLYKMPVTIRFMNRQVQFSALVDTGNSLFDPLSGCPVIVAEYVALKELLPEEARAAFEGREDSDVWVTLASLGEGRCAGRFLPVSFNSIGRSGGMLIGFRPDEAVLEWEGRSSPVRKVVVALYHGRLDQDGRYSALLHPGLLENTL